MNATILNAAIANSQANIAAMVQAGDDGDVNLIAALHYERTALLHLQAALASLPPEE
jgi:hypothetical protein